jgi:hypothetical protein
MESDVEIPLKYPKTEVGLLSWFTLRRYRSKLALFKAQKNIFHI